LGSGVGRKTVGGLIPKTGKSTKKEGRASEGSGVGTIGRKQLRRMAVYYIQNIGERRTVSC